MVSIADSDAIKDRKRVLPQHQAALTILEGRLSAPKTTQLSWLDLACGRGQIIASLDVNLSPKARAKIRYSGYDLNQEYARETSKAASQLGFASLDTYVGDLSDFERIIPTENLFDFITLTNTVHEIAPDRLAGLLVHCVGRLSNQGVLYVYDMERIKPPELGALPWSRDDIRQIVHCVLNALGASTYRPEIARWSHSTCDGWSVQIHREHLDVTRPNCNQNGDVAVQQAREEITRLLKARLNNCRSALESLTVHGAETAEEQEDKERLLFEFWAISRALEGIS
jgi:SAM-dependent methyltransferase